MYHEIQKPCKGPEWEFTKDPFPSIEEVREYLEVHRQWLRQKQKELASGFFLIEHQTYFIDRLLYYLFDQSQKEYFSTRSGPSKDQFCSLLGIGGYGRLELCPFSDIDLLFIYPQKIDAYMESIAERILYVLWDSGLDVGHSIRSIDQCKSIAINDKREATSLLDARLICGQEVLYDKLKVTLEKYIFSKKSLSQFLNVKLQELRKRHQKYGDSVYLLEPNIKEGRSGLRDINAIDWILKARYKMNPKKAMKTQGLLKGEDLEAFYKSKDLLFRLRFFLHFQNQRRQDVLDFETQEAGAKALGLADLPQERLAVEQFMQKYYKNAAFIERYVEQILFEIFEGEENKKAGPFRRRKKVEFDLVLYRGILNARKEDLFRKEPRSLMGVFRAMQKYGANLTPAFRHEIRKNLDLVNDKFRNDPDKSAIFLEILKEGKDFYRILEVCHRTGFLSAYIPEFSHLNCLVLHDHYHIYTVDTHLLFALQELEKITEGKDLSESLDMAREVVSQVQSFHVLVLAVLFHDIAKGLGKGHSERGAEMVVGIGKRLGLSEKEIRLLSDLVRHHLLMAHTTQRRDIHDPKQIIEFCKLIPDIETLRCLYLLTICDIRAVGPEVWSEWKGGLLNELYLRSIQYFERGGDELKRRSRDVKGLWQESCALINGNYSTSSLKKLFEVIPPRFITIHRPKEIAHYIQFVLSSKLEPEKNQFACIKGRKVADKGFYELAIYTHDHPGLFAQMAGVIAANHLNILGVETSTWEDGRVLDVFRLVDFQGKAQLEKETLKDLSRQLNGVLAGQIDLDQLVRRMKVSGILDKTPLQKLPARIGIENDISDFYTVVEIFTGDRMGLLYEIGQVFRDHQMSIQTALISTDVDQVADVFYVKDSQGNKIGSKEKLDHLRKDLLQVL